MSPEEETLGRVVGILDKLAIPYMLTGSVATSYHGRPRATHDADIVVDPTPGQLDELVNEVGAAGFYVDPEGDGERQLATWLASSRSIRRWTETTSRDGR